MDVLVNGGVSSGLLQADTQAMLGAGLALLDEMAYGIVVVTLQARILHANHAARHELGRRRVLAAAANVLQGRTPEDVRLVQEALGKAGDGKRCLITLSAAEGAGLTIAVLPLRADSPGQPARAALIFARASVCESLMLCFFARSHGLTATEENVLGILCQGYSAPEVATQLKVAVSTVRSHVRSLCAKTRSSGVRELVNRVAVLPPVAPALLHEPMH
jgi:DNA-binding CsgD family transcriptional regulator